MIKFKPSPYEYRRRLPHFQRSGAALFVTFHTLGFQPLNATARDIALECCLHDHGRRIHMHAAVVMPEHVHLLFRLKRDENGWQYPAHLVLQAIKGASSHRINRVLGNRGAVWDEESLDHVLRSTESLLEKLEYIRMNPVRRGLVNVPEDYQWLWINPEDFV